MLATPALMLDLLMRHRTKLRATSQGLPVEALLASKLSTLAERLRLERLRQRLSQGELAARASVHVATVARIETNIAYDPTLGTVRQLADALRVSPAWLAGFSDE